MPSDKIWKNYKLEYTCLNLQLSSKQTRKNPTTNKTTQKAKWKGVPAWGHCFTLQTIIQPWPEKMKSALEGKSTEVCWDNYFPLSQVWQKETGKCILSMWFGERHCLLHAWTDGNEMFASESFSVCVCVRARIRVCMLDAHLESHLLYLCES